MSFTSTTFLRALPPLFFLYYVLPKKAQWPLLLLASLCFYCFAGWQGLCYVVFTVLSSYLVSLRIDALRRRQKAYVARHRSALSRESRKAYNAGQKKIQRRWLMLGMALGFGLLAATKILAAPFWSRGENGMDIIVPLGISFYTFRVMGYLIDVFWGKTRAERNPCKLALFTLFFPLVAQGPISRYDSLSETLLAPHSFEWHSFARGLQRIIWGYFKKLVIADRLMIAIAVLTQSSGEYTGLFALFAMLVYAAALYSDFTGGMDIAIGIGQCLGIQIEENFLSPFRSKSIFEYWRRWHITMGTWFRDYVFYPVSVSKPIKKLPTRLKIYIATMITWFVTGIWHGVAWSFVVWGLANGVVILISQECLPLYRKFHAKFPKIKSRAYDVFQVIRTFLLLALLRSFDIYPDVPMTFRQIGSIVLRPRAGAFFGSMNPTDWLGLSWPGWLVAGLGICLLIAAPWFRREEAKRPPALFWALLVLAILLFGVYGPGYDAGSFIYTRF